MKKIFLIKRDSGQGIVEFALILPILLLLIFGIMDFSRLTYNKSIISQTARETLRLASIGEGLTLITQRIEKMVLPLTGSVATSTSTSSDDQGNQSTKIILTPSTGHSLIVYITPVYNNNLETGSVLRLSIVYNMDYLTPLTGIFGNTKTLNAVYYTRIEAPP